MFSSARFGTLLIAHAGSWSMSMGTRAGTAPANLIVPEIAPVLAASIEIAPPLRDDSADLRGGFDLLHPPANTTINARQSAGLSLRVIDDDWKPETSNCSYAAAVALMAAITASANPVVEAVPPTSRVRFSFLR